MSRCSKGKSSHVWLRLALANSRKPVARATLLALAALALGGCDLHTSYYDLSRPYVTRQDALAPGSGDAVATNKILQMQDPWPIASADRNLPQHGHVAAASIERYRTGKVIAPVGIGTSSSNYQQATSAQGPGSSLSAVPTTSSQAAAPGKP